MRLRTALFGLVMAGFLTLGLASAPCLAADEKDSAFTPAQKAAIEDIVRDLLTNKQPEIVMEAAKKVQQKMEAEMTQKSAEAIKANKDKLYNDPDSPVGGNPKGDVTLVEFFDYQCHYCKTAQPMVAKLVADDKKLRIVYKEYPILGAGSMIAARAALASVSQGKYEAFHAALMDSKERFDEATVMKIAASVGLNADKLKKDMQDASITQKIQKNIELGTRVGARGTPSFILADEVYPGVVPVDQLKKLIDEARKNGTAKK